jgi:hypothetical protein
VDAPPGTELRVEVEGVYGRLKSELIGYRFPHYLLIRIPSGPAGLSAKLFRGNTVVIRYAAEGRVLGFQSAIIDTVIEPEPLMFITCPKLMQEKSLRTHHRVETYIACKAALQQHTVDGMLIDISRHGCRCILATRLSGGILRPHPGDRIVLAAHMGAAPVSLVGVVRNAVPHAASVHLGVAFEGNDQLTEERIVQFLIKEGAEE